MEAILSAVAALEDELVELLQRMIRLPTINPPGQGYEAFVSELRGVLDGLGYATSVHLAPPDLAPLGEGLPRPNLIGRLQGDGPLVHLNGHYDVVPVGNDWTRDPFGGELADGRIYGRGSADMKSGLAAQIITEPFGPDGVGIGHKGAIWGEITIFGKQAHGSAPQLGVNAVELMARYLARLDAELRPQLETRITHYGVTPDNQRSTL